MLSARAAATLGQGFQCNGSPTCACRQKHKACVHLLTMQSIPAAEGGSAYRFASCKSQLCCSQARNKRGEDWTASVSEQL
eukprot:1160012-Pelagomonas_calceolata.AAC.12